MTFTREKLCTAIVRSRRTPPCRAMKPSTSPCIRQHIVGRCFSTGPSSTDDGRGAASVNGYVQRYFGSNRQRKQQRVKQAFEVRTVDMTHHYPREKLTVKAITLRHIASKEQPADPLTKNSDVLMSRTLSKVYNGVQSRQFSVKGANRCCVSPYHEVNWRTRAVQATRTIVWYLKQGSDFLVLTCCVLELVIEEACWIYIAVQL